MHEAVPMGRDEKSYLQLSELLSPRSESPEGRKQRYGFALGISTAVMAGEFE